MNDWKGSAITAFQSYSKTQSWWPANSRSSIFGLMLSTLFKMRMICKTGRKKVKQWKQCLPLHTALSHQVQPPIGKQASLSILRPLANWKETPVPENKVMISVSLLMKAHWTVECGFYKNKHFLVTQSFLLQNRHTGSVELVFVARTSPNWDGKTTFQKSEKYLLTQVMLVLLPDHTSLIQSFPRGLHTQVMHQLADLYKNSSLITLSVVFLIQQTRLLHFLA